MPSINTTISFRFFKQVFCVSLLLFLLCSKSDAERLPVKVFTSADGLGSNFVNFTMRDSHNFLWFCTRDGLSRFDGSRFITYKIGNDSPPGIEHILETRTGVYFITTTAGLYRFDPSKTAMSAANNEAHPILNAEFVNEHRSFLFEDRQGNIWSGSTTLTRMQENEGNISFAEVALNLPEIPNVRFNIFSIFQGQDDSLWLVTTQGLIRILPDGRRVFYLGDPNKTDPPTSAIIDTEGRIWIGRSSGINVIKPESIAELSIPGDVTICKIDELAKPQPKDQANLPDNSGEIFKFTKLEEFNEHNAPYLYQTSDKHIWISAGHGLIEFNGEKFTRHTSENGLQKGTGQMIEDLNGNLWLPWTTGLRRLDRHGLITFDEQDGIKSPTIVTVGETADGKIYAASNDFFTNLIDEHGVTVMRPAVPAEARSGWTVNQVFQDSLGEWWVLTNEKLYRFAANTDLRQFANARPVATFSKQGGLKSQEIFHIFEDSKKNIWISTRDLDPAKFGLTKVNRNDNSTYTFSEKENMLPKLSPISFAEDRDGNLWFGIYEGGLLKFSDGRFTFFNEKDGLPEGVITSLLIDKAGRLWIGSSLKGLYRVNDPGAKQIEFVNLKTENSLTSNNVRTLVEDNFGNIYAGTARGVDRLSPDGARVKHFTVSDGLAGDFIYSSIKDRSGNLWFGTPNGLSKLIPGNENQSDPPQVFFGRLQIAGERRAISELGTSEISNLELAPEQNNLQIDFFAVDFHPNQSLRYQFMLKGADKDWNEPTEQRTVNYANLSAGDYHFLVRAIDSEGFPGDKISALSFKILPPVWRRWWFIGLALLIAGGAIFALDRYRVTKTRQVENALSRSIESETRFRTLAQTASDVIITIDTESRIVFVNDAVEKVFGYNIAELLGEKLTRLMPQGMRGQHDTGLHRYTTTNRKNISWTGVELPGQHKSGSMIPLELSFGEFELNGKRYFTGIARDITERKKAQEALQKSRQERLAELERVRSRIARDLHDDVGSSLTQLALYSELAKQDGINSEPLEFLVETSNELVEAMSDIVWAINPGKDYLHDLTQRMRRFASESFTAAGIDLEFKTPESNIEMGANLRREVFLIFKESINNIVKHSQAKKAIIHFTLNENILVLSFHDDGRGFDVSQINDKFDWQNSGGGNGLLSIKRRIEDLGGEFSIESKIGHGTLINFGVPLT
jgi:PAS domain S-box-containing protein